MPRPPKPGTTSAGRDNLDPKEGVILKIKVDSKLNLSLGQTAARLGLPKGGYARQLLHAGDLTTRFAKVLEDSKDAPTMSERVYEQQIYMSIVWLSILNELTGKPVAWTDDVFNAFLRLESPIPFTAIHAHTLISEATSDFRAAIRRKLTKGSMELRLAVLSFLACYRALSGEDGNPGPDKPAKYDPAVDVNSFVSFAKVSIVYAVLNIEVARLEEKLGSDITKLPPVYY